MVGGQIVCDVDGPDYGDNELAFLDLTNHWARLLSLRTAWQEMKERIGTNFFSFELFDHTVDIRFHEHFEGMDQTTLECANDTWASVWPAQGLDGPAGRREDPCVQAVCLVVMEDGVKWTWWAKHGGDAPYATKTLYWKDIEDLEWCSNPDVNELGSS